MKKIIGILLLFPVFSFGQQVPHISQWSQHHYAINPAHTGIKTCMEVQSTIRGQWLNIAGAPTTGFVTISAPLKAKRKKVLSARHGLGGIISTDQIGPFQQFNFQLSYAGHFNFTVENRLSLGLAVGASQLSFDLAKAKPLTIDPVINGSNSELLPSATFGAWWNGKNYYVGMSLYQLIKQNWRLIGMNAQSSMHGMMNAGARVRMNESISFLPGMYIGFTKSAPLDLQLQALIDYKNRFTFGLGYRNTDAVIGFLGIRFEEKWRLIYSYDFVLSSLRQGLTNTNELTLSYSPCRNVNNIKQLCPLFE